MIPKIIHYCWFGGAEKSPLIQRCIETWRKVMPDYELKEWNESNFDLTAIPFVREAYESKKWAFVADYVRLYAMFNFGGIYMDTDVKVLKSFDPFLKYNFFTSQESHPDILPADAILENGSRNPTYKYVKGVGLCSAVMGAEKGCTYLKDCLAFYKDLHFDASRTEDFVIVNFIAVLLEKYGYCYTLEKDQFLENNMAVFRPYVFAGMSTMTSETFALHLYNGSWVGDKPSFKHELCNRFPEIYSFIQNCYYKISPRKQLRPKTKRVLIVSMHLSHPTDAGNRAAIMSQVNCYTKLGYEVHYLFVNTSLRRNIDLQEMRDYWKEYYHEYDFPWIMKVTRYTIDKIRILFNHGYWKADDHYPHGLANFVNKIDKQYNFDAIIVQYMRLSKLLTSVKIPKKAIFTHDVFAYKDIRTGGPFYETCTAHEEAKAMQRCPNIFAIQEQEAIYYQYISPLSKVYTVYNSYKFHQNPIAKNHNVLFIASSMKFNADAITKFVEEIWPKLTTKVPDANLIIAGGICTVVDFSKTSNVKILGHVDSLSNFYSLGNVVINPIDNGTGLKIKTFEALSYGKTAIVHPHSLTGVFHKDKAPLITAKNTEEWIAHLTDALSDNFDHQSYKTRDEQYIEDMNRYILDQYRTFLA